MEPEFHEGDIIIVNPSLKQEHNDYLVVSNNEEGEATFKQLNPKNAFENLLRLEISATGCVTEINFDIEIFQPQWDTPRGILYSCCQNCFRALPVALLLRLITIPNAFSGLRNMVKRE